MKHLDEYRDADAVRHLAEAIARATTRPHTLMEVCGGQTHSIMRYGLDRLLPDGVRLIHGPGCPVCVTPTSMIDAAIDLAARDGITVCSFGDMLRVPGSPGAGSRDLLQARSEGADVRVVLSPIDAVTIARNEPQREVVFFGVGFETTAPATAMAVFVAHRDGVRNFSLLASHVLVPPAIEAILAAPGNTVQGFLAAGHVCTVMGIDEYRPIAQRYGAPIVITGFEPVDILAGVLACVQQLEAGRAEVENRYGRAVAADGNTAAQRMVREVFEVVDRDWRGMGGIARSGLGIREAFAAHDAIRRYQLDTRHDDAHDECRAGDVLQGRIEPAACPAFGTRCTPEHPLGAPMVSSEGACAAWYRYRRA
ncbi:MAG: hydrogenase formation protein HypD [Planctomycetota bacterium]